MSAVMTPDERQLILGLVEQAITVTVVRASEQARELASRPSCTNTDLGRDSVSVTMRLSPSDADLLLRFIGGRT